MKTISTIVFSTMLALGALFTAGCPQRVTIADIEANPSKYQNKEIFVTGRVKNSYGVSVPGTPIQGGAYEIEDGTGSLWVISERTVPTRGTELGVKGMVGSGVNWNGRNYGLGMYEKDRRFKKR